ncbi:hypothetical protein [Salinarimonas soli]|nr:hypothetical protein [Salinarimonas soli]
MTLRAANDNVAQGRPGTAMRRLLLAAAGLSALVVLGAALGVFGP